MRSTVHGQRTSCGLKSDRSASVTNAEQPRVHEGKRGSLLAVNAFRSSRASLQINARFLAGEPCRRVGADDQGVLRLRIHDEV